MPKKLVIINGLLMLIAVGSVAFIARQLMAPLAMPLPARNRPAAAPAARDETPPSRVGAYTSVAARNLFSPARTESPPTATASASSPAVKPNLFGIVLREGAPIAYLEDPGTKRVAGYRVGDAVAGGTVQTIGTDSVVINRPDGNLDVRLRDPGKPKPPSTATAGVPGAPGAQPVAGAPVLPGVIPPAGAAGPPGTVAPGPVMTPPPGTVQPPGQAAPIIPGRRPLPPNLLRRLPQGSPSDAAPR
jgi:type II secretion system (T2SS) protein C